MTSAFGSDARVVAQCGEAFVQGLERHKVLPCGKYFPGTGGTARRGQPRPCIIGKTMAELWRTDLFPYRQLLTRLPLVLVGHAAYKAYDFDQTHPAALSENVVEGLLRIKLGYSGVAVADDLEWGAMYRGAELGQAAVQCLNAGCDLLLVGGGEKSVEQTLAGLKTGLESGTLSTRRVEHALARLQFAKRSLDGPSGKFSEVTFNQLTRHYEVFSKECRSPEQRIA